MEAWQVHATGDVLVVKTERPGLKQEGNKEGEATTMATILRTDADIQRDVLAEPEVAQVDGVLEEVFACPNCGWIESRRTTPVSEQR